MRHIIGDRNKNGVRWYLSIIISLLFLLLTSCGRSRSDASTVYKIYFPDTEYASLMSEEVSIVSGNEAGTVNESVDILMKMLEEEPSEGGIAAITNDINPVGYSIDDDLMTINFPGSYYNLRPNEEILIRAAIVETFTQGLDIRRVVFLVDGQELKASDGMPIGEMTVDSFINNTGVELNSYARSNVTLYFTDINGSGLKRYDEDVVYTSNMSMEKLALETLIGGPLAVDEQAAFPTLSPEAKLLSVTTKDRIAYANFDSSIKDEPYNVQEEVALYSIVNTLTSLPGIDQVQISVDGSTEGVFMDHMKLDELYERNDEIIR